MIVKNNDGTAYLPEWNFNGIGTFNSLEGYFIKTTLSSTLNIYGTFILPEENPIILDNGWSAISYLRTDAVPADLVFAQIVNENNLVIAKNNLGQAYLPEWDFNGIGDLMPGQGYQVKVTIKQMNYFTYQFTKLTEKIDLKGRVKLILLIKFYRKNYNLTKKKINNIYINNVKLFLFLLNLPTEKSMPIATDNNKRRRRELINKSEPNFRF